MKKKKKHSAPVNEISYYEEWYGQLISMIIKDRKDPIKSEDISDERLKPYYIKGLSPKEYYDDFLKTNKTKMKRLKLFIGITVIASVATWALKAQTKPKETQKTYTVTLPLDKWNAILYGIEGVKNRLKVSDLPSKEVTNINDSLLTLIQAEFAQQINKQIDAERPKVEVKKDSIIKKK